MSRPISTRRPGAGGPLMLKVTITGIIGEGATKAMRFEPGTTVREALRILAEKSNLRETDMNSLEEQYVLFKPKGDYDGTILDNYSSYLAANELNDNDVIEFKRRPYPIRVKNNVGKEETLMVDFLAPTSQIIVYICGKYGYDLPEKYRLFKENFPDTPLSPSLSLNEQDVPHGALILVSKAEKKSILSQLGSKAKSTGQSVIVRGDRIMGRSNDKYNSGVSGGSGISAAGVPGLFGAPLTTALKGQPIPSFMKQCFDYIRERAMDKEGIFRLSGSAVEIANYKEAFNKGEEPNLKECTDWHVVCGLLKQYLRELPEPLLTFELYDVMMENFNKPPEVLNQIIVKVPEANRIVLRELLIFLSEVVAHSASNKMPIHNVATVFAPNILRMRDENIMRIVQDTPKINTITATLILHYEVFFPKQTTTTTTTTTATSNSSVPVSGQPGTKVGFNLGGSSSASNGPAKPAPPSAASPSAAPPTRTSEDGEYLSYVRVAYDYESQNDQELDLREGDVIGVLQEHESGWWKGEKKGTIGLFPVTYCEECDGPLAEEEIAALNDPDAPAASLLAMAAQEFKGLTNPPASSPKEEQPAFFRRGLAASEYVGGRSSPGRPVVGQRTPGASPTPSPTPQPIISPIAPVRPARPAAPARTNSANNVKGAIDPKSTPGILPSKTQSLEDTRKVLNSPTGGGGGGGGVKRVPPPVPPSNLKPGSGIGTTINRLPETQHVETAVPVPKPSPISTAKSAPKPIPPVPTKANNNNNSTSNETAKELEAEKAKNAEYQATIASLQKQIEELKQQKVSSPAASVNSGGGGDASAELDALRAELAKEKKAREELQQSNASLLEEMVKLKASASASASSSAPPSRPSLPTSNTPPTRPVASSAGAAASLAPPHRRRPPPLGGAANGTSSGDASPTEKEATPKDVEAQLAEALKKLEEEAEARKAFEAKILSELAALKNSN